MTYDTVTASAEETQALGEALGRQLKPGHVVAFFGDLGAGKTTFIQGVAQGVGADANRVKSPTFVLMREYPGPLPLVHIDGYRLEGSGAVTWLDIELIFGPSKITLIEWAERFGELLPPEYLEVRLKHVSTNRRRIQLIPHGAGAEALITGLPPVTADAARD